MRMYRAKVLRIFEKRIAWLLGRIGENRGHAVDSYFAEEVAALQYAQASIEEYGWLKTYLKTKGFAISDLHMIRMKDWQAIGKRFTIAGVEEADINNHLGLTGIPAPA